VRLPVQLGSIRRTHSLLLEEMEEFVRNPLASVSDDAVAFVRSCSTQIKMLDRAIAERPASVAAHRKAVILSLCDVRSALSPRRPLLPRALP
jgi:hypothetical protein